MNMQEFMGLLATYGAAEVRLTVEVTNAEVFPVEEAMDSDAEECGCEKVEDPTCSGACEDSGCCSCGDTCHTKCGNTEGVAEKCEGGCSNAAADRAMFGIGCEGCTTTERSQYKKAEQENTSELPKQEPGKCVAQVVRVSVRKV